MNKADFIIVNGYIEYRAPQDKKNIAYLLCKAATSERLYRIEMNHITNFLNVALQVMDTNITAIQRNPIHDTVEILLFQNDIVAWRSIKATVSDWMYPEYPNRYILYSLEKAKSEYLALNQSQKEKAFLEAQKEYQKAMIH